MQNILIFRKGYRKILINEEKEVVFPIAEDL